MASDKKSRTKVVSTVKKKAVYSTAEIIQDWFLRDSSTFIAMEQEGRFEWEKGLSSYSEFFSKVTLREAIQIAKNKARDVVLSFGFPFPVSVAVSANPTSYRSGKFIHVSTVYFDEDDYTPNGKLDIFMGLTAHECCHVDSTETEVYESRLLKLQKTNPVEFNVTAYFQNVLEDERIERIMGKKLPGFCRFLEVTKDYYFNYLWEKMHLAESSKPAPTMLEASVEPAEGEPSEEKAPPISEEAQRFLSTFLRIIRYPKFVEEDVAFIEKHIRLFSAFKEVLTPYPVTTQDVVDASKYLYRLFAAYFSVEEPEKRDEMMDSVMSAMQSKEEGEPAPDMESITSDLPSATPDLDEGTIAMLKKLLDLLEAKVDRTDKKDVSTKLEPYDIEVLDEDAYNGSKDVFFIKAQVDLPTYRTDVREIQAAAGTFGAICKMASRDFSYVAKSSRTGRLDMNKLPDVLAGSPNVYIRQGLVKSNRIAAGVLDDLSGSMYGNPIAQARRATTLIEQGFKNNRDVELFIYGHTADVAYAGATEIYIYREPGYSPTGTIGSMRAQVENRDGVAVLEVAKRMRKFTSDPAVLFVIADGIPCASDYHGEAAFRHVREAAREAERKYGVTCIQVAVGHWADEFSLFDHKVVLSDFSKFPRYLSRIVQKVYLKHHKIEVE
jgi:hypothetical protein